MKGVLDAIAKVERHLDGKIDQVRTEVHGLDAKIDQVRSEVHGLDAKIDQVRSEVHARFDQVDNDLKALDKEVTAHMAVHRELEKDIELLKRRPARTAARATRRR